MDERQEWIVLPRTREVSAESEENGSGLERKASLLSSASVV